MSATREGKLRFLVATDVAARGIDISHLTHVINSDFPESAEQYVHRTGRTGRAGRTGTAISLIGPKDVGHLYMLRLTYKIRPIERQLPTQGELKTRAEADIVTFLAEAYAGRTADPMHLAVARRLLHARRRRSRSSRASSPITSARTPRTIRPRTPPTRDARRTRRLFSRSARPRDEGRGRRRETPRDGERIMHRARCAMVRDLPKVAAAVVDDGPRREAPRRADAREAAPTPTARSRPRRRPARSRHGPARSPAPKAHAIVHPTPRATQEPRRAKAFRRRRSPSGSRPRTRTMIVRILNAGARRAEAPRSGARAGRWIKRPRWVCPTKRLPSVTDRTDHDDRATRTTTTRSTPIAIRVFPQLPGITEEGSASPSPTAPRPARRERAASREGRPTRERADDASAQPREPREPREPDARRARRRTSRTSSSTSDAATASTRRICRRMLADGGGIPEAETSNIRVRDRITFVTVKKELADRAIQALAGQVVGGRTVIAEPARDKA